MAFEPEPSATPTAVEDIGVQLTTSADGTTQTAEYSAQIRMSDGTLRVRTGNLVPHLTQTQVNGLLNFMANLRTQAETELLP